ncbi:PP2C family serine/threonine-protein phosphatase [Actinoplanes sp. NPDC051851]|uniref:PP2C family protein-serine/threonine phosphatase n=1 Tax=Actinoplanes sp. NPDC051851 TaxID=3154753 RepID=UPI00343CFEB8
MILTECDACAEGRAAGAAFCEECGRALSDPPPASAAASDDSAPSSASRTPGEAGETAEEAARSTKGSGRDCPHCETSGSVGVDEYCEHCGMRAGRPRDHIEADGGPVAAAVSNRGRRHHRNEDAMWLAVGPGAADVVVCDGVSSSSDPDVASDVATRAAGEMLAHAALPAEPSTDGLADVVGTAIIAAGAAVAALAGSGDPRRTASNPACTIIAAAVRGPHVGYGWVGDSRIYWIGPDGPAEQLTEDDSWARHVIALGVDPQVAMNDPKAHAITAWLGADAGRIKPRVGGLTATAPGHLVLCSDGLWNYLTDPADFAAAIRASLQSTADAPSPLLEAARELIAYANAAGGADNITVALVPIHPPTAAEATAAPEATTAPEVTTTAEATTAEATAPAAAAAGDEDAGSDVADSAATASAPDSPDKAEAEQAADEA